MTVSKTSIRPLSRELLDDCTTYLEEQLYTQAFATLSNTLVADAAISSPAYVPPPQHICLAATLSAHPSFNTRTLADDKKAASKAALIYFRNIAKLGNAKDARLQEAFQFDGKTRRNDRSQRARCRRSDVQISDLHEERQIRSPYAHEQSLFSAADDFWSVVGWALNCSVQHKARWSVWRPWLDVMLDAMQLDLERCAATKCDAVELEATLIYPYLTLANQGRNSQRRLMRAIFADGSPKSCAEFPEVWRNETDAPKQKSDAHQDKRRKIDIDNDEYGDYLDEDSTEETPESKPRTPRPSKHTSSKTVDDDEQPNDEHRDADEIVVSNKTPQAHDHSSISSIDDYGGAESIRIRQRLLSLLVTFSRAAPSLFVNCEDLFALFTEFIRPLPLGVFQQLVLPVKPYIDSHAQISLNEMLFRPLIAVNAPMSEEWVLSQDTLEKCYAPFPALNSSAIDNAKVSLLVESLYRKLRSAGSLDDLDLSTLAAAVEEGIEARRLKIADDGRRKAGKRLGTDIEARSVLDSSALRMKSLLAMVQK